MKKYTFTIVIEEGCDEFWDAAKDNPIKGLTDVFESVFQAVVDVWPDAAVRMTKYEDEVAP